MVRDLGDSGSRGSSLGLVVRNLSDSSGAGGSLRLVVGDLGDGTGSAGSGLRLVVRDLSDSGRGSRSGSLGLVIGDLSHASGGWGLRLVVRDLRNTGGASSGHGLGLSIRGLSDTSRRAARARGATWEGVDVDGRALGSPVAVVEVVEATRVAGVEDGRATKSERAIATDGETASVDGTSLRWRVELELVVGGNVASVALLVLEHPVVEGQDERTHAIGLTLRNWLVTED